MNRRRAWVWTLAVAVGWPWAAAAQTSPNPDPAPPAEHRGLVVSSKKFTESIILGELATQLLRDAGYRAEHWRELGGTRVVFEALRSGSIDAYAEYTGTLRLEVLADFGPTSTQDVRDLLAGIGIGMTRPLGFNNTYAIGVRPETAERLGLRTISDLRDHPELRFGLSNEFLDRGDGWRALRRAYRLPHDNVRGMDHDLAYVALDNGSIDAMELYTTDAEIAYYDLAVLEDDRGFFPAYEAVILYRQELAYTAPQAVTALEKLEGRLSEAGISRLNRRAKIDGLDEARVAAQYLGEVMGVEGVFAVRSLGQRLAQTTAEHLMLVGLAMAGGLAVAVPLGVVAARRPRAGAVILGATGVIQTIPSLALLVLMIPLLSVGTKPAVAALFLYSLLPMVRGTHTGFAGIPLPIDESARALGLRPMTRLLRVDLPLALPAILAGVKTSTVITIGFATLGALIGAGGYGQPILTGIRRADTGMILEGALPAAALALVAQAGFAGLERLIVPRGLRLRRAG